MGDIGKSYGTLSQRLCNCVLWCPGIFQNIVFFFQIMGISCSIGY